MVKEKVKIKGKKARHSIHIFSYATEHKCINDSTFDPFDSTCDL